MLVNAWSLSRGRWGRLWGAWVLGCSALACHAGPPAAVEGAPSVPLYRAQLPAPATLHYLLRRGWMSGVGELRWAPAAGRYEVSLTGSLSGIRLLQQTSSGSLDAHGLAPERFSDQRARGAAHTATFERGKGISFSDQPEKAPWVPGAQDRLSWMVQLPAVVRGEPRRLAPGQTVELYVAGARGDADVWTFRFAGEENLRTEAGTVAAVKWVREPRKPHDTSVEVWLDPARQHLPVRARLASGEEQALELLLQKSGTP
jgi:hypothetical protein